MKAVNDNALPTETIVATLDWVRPVCVCMRTLNLPEAVIQDTMGFLLERLDRELGQ